MDSLKSVYNAMLNQDMEKQAQAQVVEEYGPEFVDADPEMVKQAADYDHVGRILAHNVFADLVKEAMDEAMPEASKEDKDKAMAKVMAKAKGEASDDEDDKEKDEEKKEESEKTAALRGAILERMAQDPGYVQALISKHYGE